MLCELCLSDHDENALCSNVSWAPADHPAPAPDMVGQTLGHYRLVRRLGAGGMGAVYLAEQTRIHARVAVKVLHPHLAHNESLRARFHAEAAVVNLIGHPNLVRIFDISEAPGGIPYFVMEYLEGRALSQFPRPMDPRLLASLLAQACDALEAAHRAGVVHRDLKPDNLLVVQREDEAPRLKVLDFGVAKSHGVSPLQQPTEAGVVLGTPAYMAPEQWMGQSVDGRADLHALAVTGYLLSTGRLPFRRGQLAERGLSQQPASVIPAHVLNPQVPPPLSEALVKAMAWRPDDRFASALEFKRALLAASTASPAPGPQPGFAPILHGTTPAPTPTLTSRHVRSRHPTPTWEAHVHRRPDGGTIEVTCTNLTRGGLFMCCAEPFPRLFTRIEFSLLLEGQAVECVGEVVRHVDSAQARSWDMRPGVGLQFVDPSPRLREALQRIGPPSTPSR